MTDEPKTHGATARKVVALADGTRTTLQIAEELGVSREYVSATIRRQGIKDKIVWRTSMHKNAKRLQTRAEIAEGLAGRLLRAGDRLAFEAGISAAAKQDPELQAAIKGWAEAKVPRTEGKPDG